MMYCAVNGYDKICMYLQMLSSGLDEEDEEGRTIFTLYVLRHDLKSCRKLLIRGANINHQSSRDGGKTPLHFAIENRVPEKSIKFLLKAGADPHIEDSMRLDCCDKACPMVSSTKTSQSLI